MNILAHVPARNEWEALLAYLPDLLPSPTKTPVGSTTRLALALADEPVEVTLLHGGVGKINAAASTQDAILTWRPELYALIGIAGAVNPALNELDLVIAEEAVVHDIQSRLLPAGHPYLAEHHVALPWLWESCLFPYPVRRGTVVTGDMDITLEISFEPSPVQKEPQCAPLTDLRLAAGAVGARPVKLCGPAPGQADRVHLREQLRVVAIAPAPTRR